MSERCRRSWELMIHLQRVVQAWKDMIRTHSFRNVMAVQVCSQLRPYPRKNQDNSASIEFTP